MNASETDELAEDIKKVGPILKTKTQQSIEIAGFLVSSLVGGTRNIRSLRNGSQSAKGDFSGSRSPISQESVVTAARNTRFLRLVEREIPRQLVRT
jgi:hypothetical protein